MSIIYSLNGILFIFTSLIVLLISIPFIIKRKDIKYWFHFKHPVQQVLIIGGVLFTIFFVIMPSVLVVFSFGLDRGWWLSDNEWWQCIFQYGYANQFMCEKYLQ